VIGPAALPWHTAAVQPRPAPPAASPSAVRAAAHVLLAGSLGVLGALIGVPVVVLSLFGGLWPVLVVGVLVVTAAVAGLAIALDRMLGPGLNGTAGSVNRGTLLGVAGCALVLALGWTALREDVGDDLPVALRFAAAGVPFAAIAALQWPGWLRRGTALVLVVAGAAVVVPRLHDASAERRTEAIVTEIGTTARPWVTEIDGLEGQAPQTTGSEYLWTRYVTDGDPTPVVWLLRMPDAAAVDGDPCRGVFHTPEGTFEPTSCLSLDGATWERQAGISWRQLVRRVDGTWLGATARPGVPDHLLEQALRNARPMSDDAYDDWLDTMLTVPLG
jgi:hypothetical protein